MDTERHSPRYSAIDIWSPADILDAMIEGQFAAVAAVRAARPALEGAVLAIEQRLRDGGRLVYAGAGTSGRLAVQDGAELVPTFSWPEDRLLLLMAGGHEALVRSVEGAEDESEQAVGLVRRHRVAAADVLIAVAASGTTPFTLACLREAKAQGALTIGIANNRDTPLLLDAAYPVWLDTGPEPIAGSTRMKAGTAQRIALNLLSSLVMIRLGRVYQGLMVDLTAVNSKLVRRSERILLQLSGRSREEVRDALRRANGNVKIALLLLEGCGIDEAVRLLDRTGGQLRSAKALIENASLAEDAGLTSPAFFSRSVGWAADRNIGPLTLALSPASGRRGRTRREDVPWGRGCTRIGRGSLQREAGAVPGEFIDATIGGEARRAYLAVPETGSGPGIALFHDGADNGRDLPLLSDLYAEEGYVVLCPIVLCPEPFPANNEVEEIAAVVAALRGRGECTGKVGALGFGRGGKLACRAAAKAVVDCAVSYHGFGISPSLRG